ncbi:MAG: hypothetical protein U0R17_04760 [Acidimicrobiia bacterium]
MQRNFVIHNKDEHVKIFHCDILPSDSYIQSMFENEIDILGYLSNSSNRALIGEIEAADKKFTVVVKPSSYENPLLDFEWGTLSKREVASYELSNLLGWNLVPPTLLRDVDDLECSVQLFVPHDPREHYFSMTEKDMNEIEKFAVFDYVINNADRKAGHVILEKLTTFDLYVDNQPEKLETSHRGKLWGIDHGLTFHVEDKLRTVIWDFTEKQISDELVKDLALSIDQIPDVLSNYLNYDEIKTTVERVEKLILNPYHRALDENIRAFPWPLV